MVTVSAGFVVAVATAAFGFGMLAGVVLYYYTEGKVTWMDYRKLLGDYRALVEVVVRMKKQGFVPQFEVEQPSEQDPANGIKEY